MGAGSRSTLTEDDAYAIQREIAGGAGGRPALRGTGQVVAGNSNWSTAFFGVTPEYFEARNWVIATGRGFEPAELTGAGQGRAARRDGGAQAVRRAPIRSAR